MIMEMVGAIADWQTKRSAANLYGLYESINRIRRTYLANAPYLVNRGLKRLWEELDDAQLERTLIAVTHSMRADWESVDLFDEACVEMDFSIVEELWDELMMREDFLHDIPAMKNLSKALCKYEVVPAAVFARIFLYIQQVAFEQRDVKLLAASSEQVLRCAAEDGALPLDAIARCVPFHKDGYFDGAFSADAIRRAFEIYDGTDMMSYVSEHFDLYRHLFEGQ